MFGLSLAPVHYSATPTWRHFLPTHTPPQARVAVLNTRYLLAVAIQPTIIANLARLICIAFTPLLGLQ